MVSVIVPMYNVEKYVEQCIESIIHQTYQDLEIILVDDGSPDQSGEIAERYRLLDQRISVFHKENGGLSDARNYGIEMAHGQYITFVDSDDFLLPDMIERLVNAAEDEQADLVECKNCRCREEDDISHIHTNNYHNSKRVFTGNDKMEKFLDPHDVKTTAWAKLYSNSLFDTVRYPKGKYHEDVFTTYKLVHLAVKVVSLDYIGYVYRSSSNSITTAAFNPRRLDAIEGKIEQAKFIYKEYPQFRRLANAGIVYACNSCIKSMALSKYKNKETENYIQKIYRKFSKDYLMSNVSLQGKAIALLGMCHVGAAMKVILLTCGR